MPREMIFSLVRHLLTLAGGILISKGWFDAAVLEQVIGAVIAMASAGWSHIEKQKTPQLPSETKTQAAARTGKYSGTDNPV